MTSEVSKAGSFWLELAGAGVKEHYYDVKGVRTRVLEAGSGPALLILHGTGGHAETYQRNIGPLSRHFHVIVPDMIGHGYSDRPDVDYTLDDFADHLFGLLDVIGVDRVHLSGESVGGCIAAWMTLSRPERVNRLVLNTGILDRPDEKGLVQLDTRNNHAFSAETIGAVIGHADWRAECLLFGFIRLGSGHFHPGLCLPDASIPLLLVVRGRSGGRSCRPDWQA